jgi:tetratricopeptide (TPR) repeat protein
VSALGELPLLVLGLGLLAGGVIALVLSRSARSKAPARSDLDLRIEDLEAQRDELYAKLRGSEGSLLAAADRNELELAAARVLRDLDSLHEKRRQHAPPAPVAREAPDVGATAGRSWSSRHPALAGALLGGGGVALVALLLFWAQRDAVPAPQQPMQAQQAPMQGQAPNAGGGMDRGQPGLPPQVAAQVQSLRDRLAQSPEDLAARRDLAQLLMAHEQFFDAFQEAQQILAQAPEDPFGNYVAGIVRYTMGQPMEALDLLDRALGADPAFTQASLMRGFIRLQLDDRDGAIESWEQGLAAAGGADRTLEHLLRLAREGKSAEEIMSTPPPGA